MLPRRFFINKFSTHYTGSMQRFVHSSGLSSSPTRKWSCGFSLVEIAVVLTIIGVLAGSGILTFNSILDDIRYRDTQQRLNAVSDALALYVQQHYYLPCPTNPANIPYTGIMANGGAACATIAVGSAIGLLPYAELGLTADQTRDAYGSPIDYIVNPNYAGYSIQDPPTVPNVQDACVTTGIWIPLLLVNKNPRKARFCCQYHPTTLTDLVITSAFSGGVSLQQTYVPGVPSPINTPRVSVSNPNTQTPVFILVSHGKNRTGAFIGNGTQSRILNVPNNIFENETANLDNDRSFVAAALSTNDAVGGRYFDDILLWKTQDQLLGAFGRDSCARP